MIHQVAEVLSNKKMGEEYHALTVVAPEIAEAARPGQFVNLRPPPDRSFILRRPMSIYRVNRQGDWAATVEVVFDVRGPGTAALAALRRHDPIDVVGPSGRGFTIPKERHSCLLVGGGVGATPLFFLAEELRAAGKRVDILWGASRSTRLVNPIEAKRLGAVAEFATDDGSAGHHGRITDLLAGMVARCGSQVIYSCGPQAMMAEVVRIGLKLGIPVQVAVEELMGCGVGICMTCVTPVFSRDGSRVTHVRSCQEGPVFNGARVAWEAYAERAAGLPAPPGN